MNAISEIRTAPTRWTTRTSEPEAHTRLVALAQKLAGPVARGVRPFWCAEIQLRIEVFHASRSGAIDVDPVDFARILLHILQINVDNIEGRRLVAAGRIERAIAPLIATNAGALRIRSRAHDVNSELPGWEVEEIVAGALFDRSGEPE